MMDKRKPIFTNSMFDLINVDNNNENAVKEYERIAQTGDDRSKTILAGIIVENYLDRILKLLFIDYKNLSGRSDFTFSIKISLLKSLRIIPIYIITMCDCVRRVRNAFAHQIELNNIENIESKHQNQIHQLYIENVKDPKDINLIKKFEAIYRLGYGGIRSFEQNVRMLRLELDNPDFENELFRRNEKNNVEIQEKIISEGPIKIIDRGNEIEEIYSNSFSVIKRKK